jgi:hypothetical protein
MKWRSSSTATVFLLCFVITLGLRFRTDTMHPGGPHWDEPADHHKYLYIAQHPIGSFHIQPTCWRIGVPILAKVLPFGTYRNFDILSVVFVALTGCMIYLWLCAMGHEPPFALVGVLMYYSLGGAAKMLLAGITMPDPASYFFLLLALYAIYRDNDWLCAAALAIGVLSKETVILAGPLYYTLKAVSLWDPARFKRCIIVAAPAVCVLVGVRLLIPAWNDRDDYVASLPFIYTQVSAGMVKYDLLTAFRGTMDVYRQITPVNLFRIFTYGILGIHFFLPFFAPRTNRVGALRWAPYWVPVMASMLIALNPDRRISSLFPVLIALGLNGLRALARILHLDAVHIAALFAILLVLLAKKNIGIVPFDFAAAVFLCWLAWAVARYERLKTAPAIRRATP